MANCEPTAKTDLRMLEAGKVRLRTDAYGHLNLEIGFEERSGPVRAVRCMPLTRPHELISIQDEEGEEIGIIRDLRELDPESRRALEAELDFYYLKAIVTAIHRAEARNGIITWELETSLGPKRVHVRDRQNIRPLPDGRTILTDIHGAKYEVPPLHKLDDRSRHWLEIEM
jgi:hypothetical protein